jgi:hypothetical protein
MAIFTGNKAGAVGTPNIYNNYARPSPQQPSVSYPPNTSPYTPRAFGEPYKSPVPTPTTPQIPLNSGASLGASLGLGLGLGLLQDKVLNPIADEIGRRIGEALGDALNSPGSTLRKANRRYDAAKKSPTTPPATVPAGKAPPPPFSGGQDQGRSYNVEANILNQQGVIVYVIYLSTIGKIGGVASYPDGGKGIRTHVGDPNGSIIEAGFSGQSIFARVNCTIEIVSVIPSNRLPDLDSTPSNLPVKDNEIGNFLPSPPPYYEPLGLPKFDPIIKPDQLPRAAPPNTKPTNPNQIPSNNPSNPKPKDQSDTTKKPSNTPNSKGNSSTEEAASSLLILQGNPAFNSPTLSPNISPQSFNQPNITPTTPPQTIPKPQTDPAKERKVGNPPLPDKPTNPNQNPDLDKLKENQNDILQKLSLIPAAIAAALALDQIFNAKQKQNAKEAVCEESQPNGCVNNAVKDATDPLKQKLDAAQVARDANATAQSGVLASLLAQLASFRAWVEAAFNNTVVDKVIGILNLLTNVHNAAMLTTSIKDTLFEAISQGLGAIGIKSPEGSPIDINQAVNSSVENLLKGILGAEQYTGLKESWQKANRVIQSGAAIVNTTRSLYDSTRSLNELTGNNVGRIGNALKRDGVVSENAYKSMSENNNQVNSTMERLQNLEQGVSTLASITSEAYNIRENVDQLTKDREDFSKKIAELPPKDQIENLVVKAKENTEKAVSQSPIIPLTELYKPDI